MNAKQIKADLERFELEKKKKKQWFEISDQLSRVLFALGLSLVTVFAGFIVFIQFILLSSIATLLSYNNLVVQSLVVERMAQQYVALFLMALVGMCLIVLAKFFKTKKVN